MKVKEAKMEGSRQGCREEGEGADREREGGRCAAGGEPGQGGGCILAPGASSLSPDSSQELLLLEGPRKLRG